VINVSGYKLDFSPRIQATTGEIGQQVEFYIEGHNRIFVLELSLMSIPDRFACYFGYSGNTAAKSYSSAECKPKYCQISGTHQTHNISSYVDSLYFITLKAWAWRTEIKCNGLTADSNN
jgi:hypothetical protein